MRLPRPLHRPMRETKPKSVCVFTLVLHISLSLSLPRAEWSAHRGNVVHTYATFCDVPDDAPAALAPSANAAAAAQNRRRRIHCNDANMMRWRRVPVPVCSCAGGRVGGGDGVCVCVQHALRCTPGSYKSGMTRIIKYAMRCAAPACTCPLACRAKPARAAPCVPCVRACESGVRVRL